MPLGARGPYAHCRRAMGATHSERGWERLPPSEDGERPRDSSRRRRALICVCGVFAALSVLEVVDRLEIDVEASYKSLFGPARQVSPPAGSFARAGTLPWGSVLASLRARGMVWASADAGASLVATWPSHTLGPTSRAVLGTVRQAVLLARVLNPRPPLGKCPEFQEIARTPEHLLAGGGHGGVRVAADPSGTALEVAPALPWGQHLSPRKWCTFDTCFDAQRPACTKPGPIPVFSYPPSTSNPAKADDASTCALDQCRFVLVEGAASRRIDLVTSPDEACLFVFSPSFDGRFQLPTGAKFRFDDLPHWHAAGSPGRNHVLVMPSCVTHCDSTGTVRALGSTGDAIIAAASLWRGTVMPHFDIVLPQPFSGAITQVLHEDPDPFARRRRRLLFSFKGTVFGRNMWFDSRVVVAEFSARDAEAEVDVWPKGGRLTRSCYRKLKTGSGSSYARLLLDSTFGFAPGGGGPYSYRFLEVLAAGAVPVVTEDLVLPFNDVLPWEECVVRVSWAELRGLGRVLRALAPPRSRALRRRLDACMQIWLRMALSKAPTPDDFSRGVGKLFWDELEARIRPPRAPR